MNMLDQNLATLSLFSGAALIEEIHQISIQNLLCALFPRVYYASTPLAPVKG